MACLLGVRDTLVCWKRDGVHKRPWEVCTQCTAGTLMDNHQHVIGCMKACRGDVQPPMRGKSWPRDRVGPTQQWWLQVAVVTRIL